MSLDAERAWEAILRVHTKLEPNFDRDLKAATGLTLSSYRALLELDFDGSQLTMSDLAHRVGLSRTRVSRLVDDLRDAGLVAREGNPGDGRSKFASITNEGRRRIAYAAPVYKRIVNRELGASLSPAQLGQLAEALERILSGAV